MICTQCHVGHPQRQQATWSQQVGSYLIVVPNTHAWVCDACGAADFDSRLLHQLVSLLDPNSHAGTQHLPRPSQPGPQDLPQGKRPVRSV